VLSELCLWLHPLLSPSFSLPLQICASVKVVKYLFKYIYKGGDRVMVANPGEQQGGVFLAGQDEIANYQDYRSVGSIEACARMFDIPVHGRSPGVYKMPVHLEDEQLIFFNDDDAAARAVDANRDTHLTAWMNINAVRRANGTTDQCVRYVDMPATFTWHAQPREWRPRQTAQPYPTLGRINVVSARDGACHTRPPTSKP
jgi:hypothetical protein